MSSELPQARRVADQSLIRRPEHRVVEKRSDKGAFFPNEVARMLGIEQIDNQRLRRIFNLVRAQRGAVGPRPREWARFDYVDIACTVEVLRICADTGDLGAPEFRLALHHIRRACKKLSAGGLSNPLLQARIELTAQGAIATIDGETFDISTGQQLISNAVELGRMFTERAFNEGISQALVERIEYERELLRNQANTKFGARFPQERYASTDDTEGD